MKNIIKHHFQEASKTIYALKEHEKILNFIESNNINCITVGSEFNKVNSNFKNYKTVDLLIEYLKGNFF